jgi:hypothetical protein
MSTYSRSQTSFGALPSLPSLSAFPHRNWKDAGAKGGLPAVGMKLAELVQRLQVCATYYYGQLTELNAMECVITGVLPVDNRWQIPRGCGQASWHSP